MQKLLTLTNFKKGNNKKNLFIVIHYVGAVSSARNNALYFYSEYRGESAHYFVDENEIWQIVEDKDISWHIGADKYYNDARNSNSIGIELCCKKSNNWYFEENTIRNAVDLVAQLMKKYNIPINNVVRHYDCTLKCCPEPFVRDKIAWQNFKKLVEEKMQPTYEEKIEKIKKYYGFNDDTCRYFEYYRYGSAIIDKLLFSS